MDVELLAEHIGKLITHLAKIIPLHSPVPILSNILISADQQGVTLSGTNLEIGVQITIPAKVVMEGAITVPGKHFIEVVNSIPKGKIRLFQEKESMVLSSGGNTIRFQTIPRDEFPTLIQEKGKKIHTFTSQEFANIFSNVTFVCSQDEARPALSGVYITQKEDEVHFVATDGFRLALIREDKHFFESGKGVIISSRLLNEVLSLKNEVDSITLYVYEEGNQIVFESGTVTFVGRVIEGNFPQYQKVIPTSYTTRIVFDREEMLQSLKVASVFARENAQIVQVKIEGGVLQFYSKSSGVGEGEVSLEVEQEGENNQIAFNIKFFTDFVRSASDKHITMELTTSLEPAVFKIDGKPNFLHIIMPVKV